MAIHPSFPTSPYEILEPDLRWFPADEVLRESSYDRLLPPLVHKIRRELKAWRDTGYDGASATSKALLQWWFNTKHMISKTEDALSEFRYYFAQQEAIETVIYLYEVAGIKDKYDLIRYDSSGRVSTGMFDEDWLRLVLKMATGSGKTKVMSLVVTWCYFHKLYEPDSTLATNFLLIAPNIIVLDRLQIDLTATPKHNNGAIFVQTVCDYPLVEAITQNVVKHAVLPDSASRAKLVERKSSRYTEKYADYIALGVEEWRKAYAEHEKLGKKAVLFIMTDDTKNCDDVEDYLKQTYPEFQDCILVIHTNNNGEVSESDAKKSKEELEKLRKAANSIDSWESPYKVIVSVLMLKEGWDVRNVTTIVGLRAYAAKSNILPEQTLGRGLRRMYPGTDTDEYVSVVGTDAFMDFVESIQSEGVELERRPMGAGTDAKAPIIIEVDNENAKKDLDKLDIEIPVLSPRMYREYKCLENLAPAHFANRKIAYRQFSEEEKREIVFKDITTGEINHTTLLDAIAVSDYRSVIGYFTQIIMKDLRLFGGYDVLYGKVKEFITSHLFTSSVEIDDLNTLRNLSEMEAGKAIVETFKKKINELTVQDKGNAEIRDYIKLRQTRPFVVKDQGFLIPQKSLFNKITGDSQLELVFASFLERCDDVHCYAKNYFAVHFNLDYVNSDGNISGYYPDFIVKTNSNEIYIIETKGLEDLDVPLKMERLRKWCEDINTAQKETHFDYVFVDEEDFERYKPGSFSSLVVNFRKYKDG